MNYYQNTSLSVRSIFTNLHINHSKFTAVCFPFSFLSDSNSDSGKCRKLQAKTDEMVKADTAKANNGHKTTQWMRLDIKFPTHEFWNIPKVIMQDDQFTTTRENHIRQEL